MQVLWLAPQSFLQMFSLFVTFCIGALFDFLWVFYTNAFITRRPVPAALMAMWLGGASLCGLGHALSNPYHAYALVLGYATGTFIATKWL